MKVLVTGATGFIGNAVAHRLVEEGHKVRCLVREGSDTKGLADIVWEKAVGDIARIGHCREAMHGMEAVVHCAAHVTDFGPWKTFRKINVQGSANIAEAALGSKVRRFVYLSTCAVLGCITDSVLNDTMPCKRSGFPYPDTKIEAEELLFDLFRKRQLPLVSLRPVWVYGPGDRTFLPVIVDAMAKKYMCYFGDRKNRLYMVYIDNVVDAVILSLEKEQAIGRAYLVSDGDELTWEELCTRLADGLDLRLPWLTIPYTPAYGMALGMEALWTLFRSKSRPVLTRYIVTGLGGNMRYDDSRVREELEYQPGVSLEEGLERTIAWLKKQPIGKLTIK